MGKHEKRKKKRKLFTVPVEKPKKDEVSFTTFKGKNVKHKRQRRAPKKAGVPHIKRSNK